MIEKAGLSELFIELAKRAAENELKKGIKNESTN